MKPPLRKSSAPTQRSLFLIICVFAPLTIANQQSEHEKSLKQISLQIESISKNLNANKKLLKSEQDKLAEIEQDINGLQKAKRETQKQITKQENKLNALKEQASILLDSQQDKLAALALLIRERYKEGSPNPLKMLLNQENPHAVGRLENYYRYFSEAQRNKIEELRAALTKVELLRQEQTDISIELQQTNAQLDQQEEKLEETKTQRNQRVSRLDEKVSDSQQQLTQLKADRDRLDSLLKEIVAKAARLAAIEEQRRAESAQQQASRPNRTPVRGGFKKQQGRLSVPVVAKLKYRFGSRLAASGMRAQGNFYNTKPQQSVSAIFRGQVIFADYLKGYGLLMIIDHGDDHISLYGHNEVLYKKVGDAVVTGETISKSGVSGGLKQPGLYFEIRHNAAPIDPTKWLSRG